MTKQALFMDDCISIAMLLKGMSYWDAYIMPVEARKHMINMYIKMQNKEASKDTGSDMAAIAKKGLPNLKNAILPSDILDSRR